MSSEDDLKDTGECVWIVCDNLVIYKGLEHLQMGVCGCAL